MVGTNLDQTITSRIPGTLCRMLFPGPRSIRLFIQSGAFLDIITFLPKLILTTFKGRVTTTFTTVFSALSCFGLAAVSTWFASERWAFARHNGRKWLADVLSETKVRLYQTPGIKWLVYEPRAITWRITQKTRRVLGRIRRLFHRNRTQNIDQFSMPSSSAEKLGENGHATSSVLPVSASPELGSPITATRHRSDSTNPLMPISEGSVVTLPMSFDTSDDRTVITDPRDLQGQHQGNSPAKGRLKSAVRSVMLRNAMAQTPFGASGPRMPRRQRTTSSDGQNGEPLEEVASMRGSRVAALVPKLKSLEMTQDLAAHTALVRHMQFSPNGKYLATSRYHT